LKVALGQIDCHVGDVAANVATMADWAHRAADQGCDVVVFPEMADTGYDMKTIERHAGCWDGGACRDLRRTAAEHRIAIIAGLSDRRGDSIGNGAVVIDNAGELLASYRKIHLFSYKPICEDQHLAGGDELCLFDLAGWRCGLMICYDIRFPELARALTLRGAEVLFVVAAWPTTRIGHWKLLNLARAVENQLYVAAVNRVGHDGATDFGGSSSVIDPLGEPKVNGSGNESELLVAELRKDRVLEVRDHMRVFDDRRPELYARWQASNGA